MFGGGTELPLLEASHIYLPGGGQGFSKVKAGLGKAPNKDYTYKFI